MAGYNRTRFVEELLERTESSPPSFTVHLHLEYWTLNQGSKFLYNNQIASLLDDIRAHRIPVDFLDLFEAAKVPFYDGCMIVELLDYRPQRNKEHIPEKPERTRAVLHPNSETLWADICSLNQRYGGKWTDKDALAVEARLLLAISPPLCLDPDPHLTRMANHVLRVSTPTVPVSLKRKAAALDPEEDETDKARRTKIMQFMNPQTNRTHAPSYRILDAIQNARQASTKPPTPLPGNQFMSNPPQQQSPAKPPTPAQNFSHAQSPAESEDSKDKVKKTETPKITFATPTFQGPNGSHTPAPPQTTHFINHLQVPNNNATGSPNTRSPMQPQVYPNLQAATDSAKRAPTPAQRQHYSQSPRPPSSQAHNGSQPPIQHPSNPNQIPTPTFQPTMPNPQFLNAPPAGPRAVAPKPPANNVQMPQPPQMANYTSAQLSYAQQQQHQAAAYLRMNAQRNGRATPQGGQSAPSATAARNSPVGRPIAARSPMPPNAQPPQQKHPPQHPQTVYTTSYNPAQLRPIVHGNPSPHPQAMPAHLTHSVAGAAPNGSNTQDGQQPQMHAYAPQMYGYSPMNFAPMPGRMTPAMAAGYWQMTGMGRGIPMTGQPMPGMTATPPQMPVGKAGPPQIPGR